MTKPTGGKRGRPPIPHENLRELVAQGLFDHQIAERLGVATSTVFHWRHAEGIPANGFPGPDHATHQRYTAGCRCDLCTAANTAYHMAKRYERRMHPLNPDVPHGTPSAYLNHGCRCAECKAAGARENKRKYETRRARIALQSAGGSPTTG